MIRRAEERDIADIGVLLQQVLAVHHVGRPDIFREHGEKYTPDRLKDLMKDDTRPIFVYENEAGRVIGHCFCMRIENPETSATYAYNTLYIDDLCVLDTERGHHVGTQLLTYVKEWAMSQNIYNITLHVWEQNADGRAFYEAFGMTPQQTTMELILTDCPGGSKTR